jgi:NAD(P)-dependent dehydrogenase (short-subunit alcohol dehydrogenase family)
MSATGVQTNRTWLVTGAASGLGYHLTTQLLARGDRVMATDLRPGPLSALSHRYPDRLSIATLDVASVAAIRAVTADAFSSLGRIDVIVSNAGFGLLGAAEELSDEQLHRQIDVNLIGGIQLARTVVPYLRAQGGGHIIQVSSSGGQVPDPGMSVYNATKFGLEGFYESLAIEVAPFGIEVTLIEPGGARTPFNDNLLVAAPIAAYETGIVGQIRGMLTSRADPEFARRAVIGDPAKMAAAIIETAGQSPPRRRVVLGSNAHQAITAALRERLADIEAHREYAYSTDGDDVIAADRRPG